MSKLRNKKKASPESKGRVIKEKFKQEKESKVDQILPKTANQSLALLHLLTKQCVVLRGSSGTGKSHLACVHAANMYLKGKVDRIVILRPYEFVGRSIGARPGDTFLKMLPLVQTMLDNIELVVGSGELQYMLENGKLVVEATEDVRGRSYKNSVVIMDEAANADIKVMKAVLTRLEETSQLILCGDEAQKDINCTSGLNWMVNLIEKVKKSRPDYLDTEDINQALTNIGVVTFTNKDIVRSGLTAFWVKVFDNEV